MSESPEATTTDRPRRVDGVIAQESQGQTVLLRLEDGGYYAVDEVGAAIWALCDGTRSVEEIVAGIYAEFDAPEEAIHADVIEFVDDLRREHLLLGAGA